METCKRFRYVYNFGIFMKSFDWYIYIYIYNVGNWTDLPVNWKYTLEISTFVAHYSLLLSCTCWQCLAGSLVWCTQYSLTKQSPLSSNIVSGPFELGGKSLMSYATLYLIAFWQSSTAFTSGLVYIPEQKSFEYIFVISTTHSFHYQHTWHFNILEKYVEIQVNICGYN